MWERRLNDRSTSAEELDQMLRTGSWAFPEIFWPRYCQGIPGKVSGKSTGKFRESQGISWDFREPIPWIRKYRESTGKLQGISGKVQGVLEYSRESFREGSVNFRGFRESRESTGDFRETFRGFQGKVQGISGDSREKYREFQGVPGNSLNSLNRRCLSDPKVLFLESWKCSDHGPAEKFLTHRVS